MARGRRVFLFGDVVVEIRLRQWHSTIEAYLTRVSLARSTRRASLACEYIFGFDAGPALAVSALGRCMFALCMFSLYCVPVESLMRFVTVC